MKGQISLIEAIFAVVAMFIAFNMIISTGDYQTEWKGAINSMQGRDIIVTADRMGKLHEYAFSPALFGTEVLNKLDSIKDSIRSVGTQDSIKNIVYIACDCTAAQVTYIQDILADVKFNSRSVTGVVCSTTLPTISACGSGSQYPSALVIWGYKDLSFSSSALTDFLKDGGSVIEIADLSAGQIDSVQSNIFGLKWNSPGDFPLLQDLFIEPRDVFNSPYQPYKWFHHLPYMLKGTVSEAVPTEGGIPLCGSLGMRGDFKFQDLNRRFWICGTSSVYWDTDNNNVADTVVVPREGFTIVASNFMLNYIDATDTIRVSFKAQYLLDDILGNDNSKNKISPKDNDKSKVLLARGYWDGEQEIPISAVIVNNIENGKTVWAADFSRVGLSNTGDDHKQLLSSLIFSTLNRKTQAIQQIGQITSYVNAVNEDILEIYRIELSIGTPF